MRTLIFGLAVLMCGCGRVEEKTDSVGEARHLLNAERYDQVIAMLAGKAESDKASPEIRILLASAYAGSVGLNLIDSYGAFESLLFKKPLLDDSSEEIPGNFSFQDTALSEREKNEIELRKMIDGLVDAGNVVLGLKWVAPEQRGRLLRAASQLERVPQKSPHFASAIIYRYLLFVDLFVSSLRDALPNPRKVFDTPVKFACEVRVASWNEFQYKLETNLALVNSAAGSLSHLGKEPPKAFVKLNRSLKKIETFLSKNQQTIAIAHLLKEMLQTEYCE